MNFLGEVVLNVLSWLVPPERVWRLFRRHSAAATIDIAIFDGRVEVLTDELLSHPADAARKRQFYEMAPLDWDILAAHADIERDQQGSVIEQLRQPSGSLRFVCICGESGSGKSTLAWRAAAELYRRDHALVIRVKDKEDPDVWYQMPEFCTKTGLPVLVLADDLFRNPDVCRALRELNSQLPLTVLATSQMNEYRPGRLKGQVVPITLGPPSIEEKRRVLRRLRQNLWRPSPEQLSRIEAANEFLVLMVELTSGKGFQQVIEDSLDSLSRLYEPVYHAYEYLCFSYSYGIALPTSVLERLDAKGRLHDLPKQLGAQGLIFYDESRSESLRPGHPRRAEMARRLFERHRSSATVLSELVKAVDVSRWSERRFIAHLLRSLASHRRTDVLEEALPYIEHKVAECFQQASRVSELTIWRAFYLALDRHDEAHRCVDAALAVEPVSSHDCLLALGLYRERGRERDALPVLDRWVHNQPEWGGVGPAYLGLVDWYGTQSHQQRVIDETSPWLVVHPDDIKVRSAFLGLVEWRGTAGQVERLLQETPAWLAAHPNDIEVRKAFLGLVEWKGTAEQTARVLQETPAWLSTHPTATEVWACFISCLCALNKLDDARAFAEEAVAIHSTNPSLALHYLKLMNDRVDEATMRHLYDSLIGTYPRDLNIKNEWARWLHTHNYRNEAEEAFKALIAEHPRSFQHPYSYGRLLLDMERYDEAAVQFRRVLVIRPRHAMAHDGLAQAVHGLARRAEEAGSNSAEAVSLVVMAEREFKSAIYWAGVANDREAVFFTHLGWFYIDRKRWDDALGAFDRAANEDPEYFGNYLGQGHTFVGLEQWADATRSLGTALEKARATLEPPALEDIRQLIERCEAALTNSSHESPVDAV